MMKPTTLILIATLLLNSCAAVVLVGAAGAAGGMAVYDRRSMKMIELDAKIFYQINREIVKDTRFKDSHIVVSSFNQNVLLAGETPSASLRIVADKIAKSRINVKRVYNDISIGKPLSITDRGTDSFITTSVKTQMLAQKGLESGSIHIVTEKRVVYLMGIASREQANLAVNVARQVQGVSKVVKIFQYQNY